MRSQCCSMGLTSANSPLHKKGGGDASLLPSLLDHTVSSIAEYKQKLLPLLKTQVIVNKDEVVQPLTVQPIPLLQMHKLKNAQAPFTPDYAGSLT